MCGCFIIYLCKIAFSIDLDKCVMRGEAFTPSLSVVGEYILKGQLLVFPINGRGLSNNTLCKYVTQTK